MIMSKRLDGITYLDVDATAIVPPRPFWLITRWDQSAEDLIKAEREETAIIGVTDFDDFGIGICFNRKEDADTVAIRMADRFGIAFGVYGPGDDGMDGVWLALPPE